MWGTTCPSWGTRSPQPPHVVSQLFRPLPLVPSPPLNCPLCDNRSRVVESRQAADGAAVRRRRECVCCAHRFTTFERLEPSMAIVRKRDGRRQEFDTGKVRAGPRARRPQAARGRGRGRADRRDRRARGGDRRRALDAAGSASSASTACATPTASPTCASRPSTSSSPTPRRSAPSSRPSTCTSRRTAACRRPPPLGNRPQITTTSIREATKTLEANRPCARLERDRHREDPCLRPTPRPSTKPCSRRPEGRRGSRPALRAPVHDRGDPSLRRGRMGRA